jgi:hypothetical protein
VQIDHSKAVSGLTTLVLVRSLVPNVSPDTAEREMCLCLLFLCSRCPGAAPLRPTLYPCCEGGVVKLGPGQDPEGTADGEEAKMPLLHL